MAIVILEQGVYTVIVGVKCFTVCHLCSSRNTRIADFIVLEDRVVRIERPYGGRKVGLCIAAHIGIGGRVVAGMADQVVFNQHFIGASRHNPIACNGIEDVVADHNILMAKRDAILLIPRVPSPRAGASIATAGDAVTGHILNQAVFNGQSIDIGLSICAKGNGCTVVALRVPAVDVVDV